MFGEVGPSAELASVSEGSEPQIYFLNFVGAGLNYMHTAAAGRLGVPHGDGDIGRQHRLDYLCA